MGLSTAYELRWSRQGNFSGNFHRRIQMSTASRSTKLQPQAGPSSYLPTPEEISLACLTIQARWSVDETIKRQVTHRGYLHLSKVVDPQEIERRFKGPEL
jgi:hypothetical protein